ncbi:MAG: transposase [Brasilonema sp.]
MTGEHFLHEYPKLNGDYFQQFLDWLSQQLGEDYAILQIDQASAHMSSAIRWPENVIPLVQPPHSPELNPIERLWQFLKQPLKNQLFSDLQALRDTPLASALWAIAFKNCLSNSHLNRLYLSLLITLS